MFTLASTLRRTRPLILAAAVAGMLALMAPPAPASVKWLCRPGLAENPCEIALDKTLERRSGPPKVRTTRRPPQRRRLVDCFYVYPTVSNQPGQNADKSRDPELSSIAKYQAARFSSKCRIFAPVYRQSTVAGLLTSTPEQRAAALEVAYADVVAAWRRYMRRWNRGRGVVLLGHSQGTRLLRALVRSEIDPRPAARGRLVGALLLGGNVTVRRGSTRGGDFRHIPLCTRRGQFGCVVAYSSFAADPPDNTRFGKLGPADVNPFGLPTGPGYAVACTDPARLSGFERPFGITVPSEPFAPGLISVGIATTSGGRPPSAETTWVETADRYRGRCRTVNGAHVLRYDPTPGSRRPNPAPDPSWGTHLIDVNLGLERLVRIVGLQARAWLRARDG